MPSFKMLDCNCVTLKLFLKELNNVNFVKNVCNATRVSNVLKTLLSNCLKGIKWLYADFIPDEIVELLQLK
jgi:hypothetical protein